MSAGPSLTNTQSSYGWVSIMLHWLSALAVFGLFGLGIWMVDLTYYSSWYQTAPHWHKSIGLLLLLATLGRLLWKWATPSPSAEPSHGPWTRRLTTLGHLGLYSLLLVLMVSGYLISTADGRAIAVFDWFEIPATLTSLPQQEELAGTVHEWLAWSLLVLALGHGVAALKHHFIDRDSTLRRMLKPQY